MQLYAALPVLLAVAVYLPTLRNGFVYDDKALIAGDPRVRGFDVRAILGGAFWHSDPHDPLYRPLGTLLWAAEFALFGDGAAGYHLVSLLLHAANVAVLLAWARRLGCRPVAAALAAGVFAVHPLASESVCWASSQNGLAASLLGLLALHGASAGRTGARRAVMIAGLWLMAMGAKETAILLALPLAMIWIVRARRGNRMARAGVAMEAMLGAAALAAAIIVRVGVVGWPAYGAATGLNALINPLLVAGRGGMERWGTAVYLLGLSVRLMAWPAGLSADYSFESIPLVTQGGDGRLWGGVIVGVALLGLLVGSARRAWRGERASADAAGCVPTSAPGADSVRADGSAESGPLSGCAAAILLLLAVPQMALAAQIPTRTGVMFAERILYMPLAAMVVCAVMVVERCVASARGRARAGGGPGIGVGGVAGATIAIAVCCVLSVLTLRRVAEWREDATLFDAALRARPGNARMAVGLAEIQLSRALDESDPRTRRAAIEPWIEPMRRGLALTGRREFACDELSIRPRRRLYQAYLAMGAYQRAEQGYRQLVRWLPDDAAAWTGLADALAAQGLQNEVDAARGRAAAATRAAATTRP